MIILRVKTRKAVPMAYRQKFKGEISWLSKSFSIPTGRSTQAKSDYTKKVESARHSRVPCQAQNNFHAIFKHYEYLMKSFRKNYSAGVSQN
jgi:hypothetical protein